MKGRKVITEKLNALLADELSAINQGMVHSEMCANWGYERIHGATEERLIMQMRHAEELIARILFLEGTPVVTNLGAVHIGSEVEAQLRNDLAAEHSSVTAYNEGVHLAAEVGDNGTRALFERILADEESQACWLEAQLDQISQVGMQNYLMQQIG